MSQTVEINSRGFRITIIRDDEGALIKIKTEKPCGCQRIHAFTYDEFIGYDDIELCEYHQFLFDKEVKEWENEREGEFPDDVEFFYREEQARTFKTYSDASTQTA